MVRPKIRLSLLRLSCWLKCLDLCHIWYFPSQCLYGHRNTNQPLIFHAGSAFISLAVHKSGGGKRDVASHAVCVRCLGNTYKYQAGNRMNALLWFKHLSAACQSNRQQVRSFRSRMAEHFYRLLHMPVFTGAGQPDVVRVSHAEECDRAKERGMRKRGGR